MTTMMMMMMMMMMMIQNNDLKSDVTLSPVVRTTTCNPTTRILYSTFFRARKSFETFFSSFPFISNERRKRNVEYYYDA